MQCDKKYVITKVNYNTDGSLGWIYAYDVAKANTHFTGTHFTNDTLNVGDSLCYIN